MTYTSMFFVCFTNADKWRWWHLVTGCKCAHVFLILPLDNYTAMMISPSEGGIEWNYYNKAAHDLVTEAENKGSKCVNYVVAEENMQKPRLKFFRTCVGITKDFLGINKWWIITPSQLYAEVIK